MEKREFLNKLESILEDWLGYSVDIDENTLQKFEEEEEEFEDFASYLINSDEIQNELELACEFTYYGDAIEYLASEDASLQEAIKLAEEYGYNLSQIDSCILASLLKRENLLKIYQEIFSFRINELYKIY